MNEPLLRLTSWQRRRLRRQLHTTLDARIYRRTLALLEISEGKPLLEMARTLGVSRRTLYYWIEYYTQSDDP